MLVVSSNAEADMTMGAREQILKAIEKKRAEAAEHERLRLAAEHHVKGLEEALKALPKEGGGANGEAVMLREDSGPAKARDFLQKLGRPAHIAELVEGIGREPSHENK